MNKILRQILIAVLVLLLVAAGAAFSLVVMKGRAFVAAELSRAVGKKVSVRVVRAVFPSSLILKDVRIDGLASVSRILVKIELRSLFGRHWRIASVELISPEINIGLSAPVPAATSPAVAPLSSPDKAVPVVLAPSVRQIGRIVFRDGTLMVQAPSTGKTWILKNVTADLKNVPLDGLSAKTEFLVSTSLEKMNMPFVGHLARARGWVNWAARDMEANVEAVDEAGRIGLSAVITARANAAEVKGRVRLLASQPAQASGKRPKMIEGAVLDLLSSMQTGIDAEFSFHTPLDRPEVSKVFISGNITTGLHSEEISGNIVGSLKAAGAKLLSNGNSPTVKPYKP
ncbi:MAG: hypothetical protein HQL22_02775 [Candidatus Omnitrophica bacterium]|nr:hypothetical protein [Candidatus Omnitrophota bacterium]